MSSKIVYQLSLTLGVIVESFSWVMSVEGSETLHTRRPSHLPSLSSVGLEWRLSDLNSLATDDSRSFSSTPETLQE